jgi:hypothetical protein
VSRVSRVSRVSPVSRRRLAVVAAAVVAASLAGCAGSATVPACDDPANRAVVLVAQSVPSATLIPCVGTLPSGWAFAGSTIAKGETTMWLNSTVAGLNAVEVNLTESCDVGNASEILPAPDEAGAQVYSAPSSIDPFRGIRFIVFDGGCVRYRYTFATGAEPSLALAADEALSFVPRTDVAAAVETNFDQTLCGVVAPSCEGSS